MAEPAISSIFRGAAALGMPRAISSPEGLRRGAGCPVGPCGEDLLEQMLEGTRRGGGGKGGVTEGSFLAGFNVRRIRSNARRGPGAAAGSVSAKMPPVCDRQRAWGCRERKRELGTCLIDLVLKSTCPSPPFSGVFCSGRIT